MTQVDENPGDENLVDSALREINRLIKQGAIPVNHSHLNKITDQANILDLLLFMRNGGLISGDLITVGTQGSTPHKLTNIRLTYIGLRKLKASAGGVDGPNAS